MPKKKAAAKISPYTLLNRWLYDGSTTTICPPEVSEGYAISQIYILYFFQQTILNVYINSMFNNYYIFNMPKEEVFGFIKDAVSKSGYKPKFIPNPKTKNEKLFKILKSKYPYLKPQEVNMMTVFVEELNDDEKGRLYEMFGLYKPRKKKTTKANKKMLEKKASIKKPIEEKNHPTVTDILKEIQI